MAMPSAEPVTQPPAAAGFPIDGSTRPLPRHRRDERAAGPDRVLVRVVRLRYQRRERSFPLWIQPELECMAGNPVVSVRRHFHARRTLHAEDQWPRPRGYRLRQRLTAGAD